jgi:hypothetical protein
MDRPRWKPWVKRAIKAAIGVLVLWAVARHVRATWTDLKLRGESLHVDAAGIVLGAGLYLLGLCALGIYFGRVVNASATPIGYLASLRAYLISHLGKYVPGKAMVVVMRVGLVVPYGARAASAAFATLYETLTMMAAGGLVAAVGFVIAPVPPIAVPLGTGRTMPLSLPILGLALGVLFWVVVEPRVFPRLSALVSTPFRGVGPDALPRLSQRLLLEGLLWSLAGWVLMGLSQVAVVWAFVPSGVAPTSWPLVIASVALATVAGFVVAIFPGGLVVREGVLMAALVPAVGDRMAVVSALALRLTWILAELFVAAVLTVIRPPLPRTGPT